MAAAKAFTWDVRLGACAQPQTQEDILCEILRVQQEQLALLRALLVSSLPASWSSSGSNHSSLPVRPMVLFQWRVLAAPKGDVGLRGPRSVRWLSLEYLVMPFGLSNARQPSKHTSTKPSLGWSTSPASFTWTTFSFSRRN